ncbi:hypothetical protein NDU88_001523, partial [Pleurodeles waltl]
RVHAGCHKALMNSKSSGAGEGCAKGDNTSYSGPHFLDATERGGPWTGRCAERNAERSVSGSCRDERCPCP